MTREEFRWFLRRYDFDTCAGGTTYLGTSHQRRELGSIRTGLVVTKGLMSTGNSRAYSQILSGREMGKLPTLLTVPCSEVDGYRNLWAYPKRTCWMYHPDPSETTASIDDAEIYMSRYLEDYKHALMVTQEHLNTIDSRISDLLEGGYNSWGLDIVHTQDPKRHGCTPSTNIDTIRIRERGADQYRELKFGPQIIESPISSGLSRSEEEGMYALSTDHLRRRTKILKTYDPSVVYSDRVLDPFDDFNVILRNDSDPEMVSPREEIEEYVNNFFNLARDCMAKQQTDIFIEIEYVNLLLNRIKRSKSDRGGV